MHAWPCGPYQQPQRGIGYASEGDLVISTRKNLKISSILSNGTERNGTDRVVDRWFRPTWSKQEALSISHAYDMTEQTYIDRQITCCNQSYVQICILYPTKRKEYPDSNLFFYTSAICNPAEILSSPVHESSEGIRGSHGHGHVTGRRPTSRSGLPSQSFAHVAASYWPGGPPYEQGRAQPPKHPDLSTLALLVLFSDIAIFLLAENQQVAKYYHHAMHAFDSSQVSILLVGSSLPSLINKILDACVTNKSACYPATNPLLGPV